MMAKLIIREVAESKGLKQSDVLEKSGVTAQLLYRYWHGYINSVSLKHIEEIAKALGVKSRDLIVDENE
jgi:transcriptional regulator with XRE-family HTH domain